MLNYGYIICIGTQIKKSNVTIILVISIIL